MNDDSFPGTDHNADGSGLAGIAFADNDDASYHDPPPYGYLTTSMDGTIVTVNDALLDWLGHDRHDLVNLRRFADLLTADGRRYHQTHLSPLLGAQGRIGAVALELATAAGARLPVWITSILILDPDGSPASIRTAVFDSRHQPFHADELLRARAQADAAATAAAQARREVDQARERAEAAAGLVEAERVRLHQLTAALQKTLLPPELPPIPGMQVSAHYHVASIDEVGGDFYDLFPLTGDTWGFFLGDVCGKGIAAAVTTSLIRYTLRATAVYAGSPAAVLENLNHVLNHRYHSDRLYCTVLYGLLRPDPHGQGCSITLASGGHPPAILLHADGTTRYLPTPGGQLIGALQHVHITTVDIHLKPGDTLLLYTDGLPEARTATGPDRFGEQALFTFAASAAPTTAPALIEATMALLEGFGAGVDDDTALMALSIPAPKRLSVIPSGRG